MLTVKELLGMWVQGICAALAFVLSMPALVSPPVPATVATCFTPAERCTPQIVSAINAARREIRVQAFGFTSQPIIEALMSAYGRGVDVEIILDRSDVRPGGDRAALLVERDGIPVWIDPAPGIAHNKVVIIDGHLVVGGSFNFIRSAETRNAENVTFTESVEIARRYLENWASRRSVAAAFRGD